MHCFRTALILSFFSVAPLSHAESVGFRPLFDGQSFKGWEGKQDTFRIVDNSVVGGNLDEAVLTDEFLCTVREFGDFELRLDARMIGEQIGGASFRGQRVVGSTQVGGYQADMGFLKGEYMPIVSDLTDVDPDTPYPLWGSLLDEYRPTPSRYPDPSNPYRLIAIADRSVIDEVVHPNGWNNVAVIALGSKIEIHLNGVKTIEYTEQDDVPRNGLICLQAHAGPPSEARYRNIQIREISH